MVLSLLEHFEASTGAGSDWYPRARGFARELSREHGGGLARPAGIIAALSPQLQWNVNRRIAAHYMAHGEPGEGCLRLSDERAHAIWRGHRPLDILGGPKTRAFYCAIMGDDSAAVVDTWMGTALGWPHSAFSARQYERCADALSVAAGHARKPVTTFQAIVWTQVRGSDS